MKKRERENFRVEITPFLWGKNHTEDDYERACNQIVRDVKRHIDDVSQVGAYWDVVYVCSHCGYGWYEDEDGCPACCDPAQYEWATENPDLWKEKYPDAPIESLKQGN